MLCPVKLCHACLAVRTVFAIEWICENLLNGAVDLRFFVIIQIHGQFFSLKRNHSRIYAGQCIYVCFCDCCTMCTGYIFQRIYFLHRDSPFKIKMAEFFYITIIRGQRKKGQWAESSIACFLYLQYYKIKITIGACKRREKEEVKNDIRG